MDSHGRTVGSRFSALSLHVISLRECPDSPALCVPNGMFLIAVH